MEQEIILAQGELTVELSPRHGGRLASFKRRRDGVTRDIVPPLTPWQSPPSSWPKQGAYPLLPYSNRISKASLRFDGRAIALRPHPASGPHTLHGPAHLRPWQVRDISRNRAILFIDYPPDADWPWPFHGEQIFELTDEGLDLALTLRNDAQEAAPAGIGWHPYLACEEGSVLRHDAKWHWPHDADHVATGTKEPTSQVPGETAYLSDWSFADLVHPDGSGVRIATDGHLPHLVLHRPIGAGYACIEPVSHVSNGFNLAASGVADTGLVVLQPGQTLAATVRLTFLPPARDQIR